jgi:uncharacterized membrane protein YjdF
MTLLGREAHFPIGAFQWLELSLILAVIGVTMVLASGWSTAFLGIAAACAAYLYDHHLTLPVAIAIAGALALARGVRVGQAPAGRRAVVELAFLGAGLFAYEWGRSRFVGSESHAHENAKRIIGFERRIGLYVEDPIQRAVLKSDEVARGLNWVYSFAFLSLVIGTLFYLYVSDERIYGIYRSSLGISALLALTTIALFPTAPPRLVAESGVVDTHHLFGKGHGFVNQFAAMPSLHVGWFALAGVMLSRTVRGNARWLWVILPVVAMAFTVMATGNHYLLDGVVGTVYAIVPAIYLMRRAASGERRKLTAPGGAVAGIRAPMPDWTTWSAKSRFTVVSLGSLLIYLLVREGAEPGFTGYWGYMVGQIAATIVILVWLENKFADEGGLSWFTHLVVIINTWADSLGTAAHMYDRFVSYDKITHFMGGVMLTAAAADIIFALQRRRKVVSPTAKVLVLAICISVSLGACWEIYEFLGDRVFNTGRHAGALDTWYDLTSDTVGSIVGALLLWRWRAASPVQQEQAMVTMPNPR